LIQTGGWIKENPVQRFPYGIADFAAMIGEGYFYIDRTDRIPLIEEPDSAD